MLIGKQQAIVSSSDRAPATLDELVERAVAMARAIPEDPFCGLADPDEITHDWPALDMLDPDEPTAETLIERARAAEEAALAVPGVTNSEGRRRRLGPLARRARRLERVRRLLCRDRATASAPR